LFCCFTTRLANFFRKNSVRLLRDKNNHIEKSAPWYKLSNIY
jgi:hypothetical protein